MTMHFFDGNLSFSDLWTLLTVAYTALVIITVVALIVERREPVRTLAWIMVITMVPVVGIVMFFSFGLNHRKQKIFNLKETVDMAVLDKICSEQLNDMAGEGIFSNPDLERNRDFITLLLNNNKSLLTLSNRVEILRNGTEAFPSLFEAMRQAKETINIESFIINGGHLFEQMCTIIEDRVREGVKVRIVYDSVGSRSLRRTDKRRLCSTGADVRSFMPVFFTRFTSKANYRNHRKIAVIDGKVAFTGGMNIADRYVDGIRGGVWRDTHLRIEGDSVKMLQMLFAVDWQFVSGEELMADNRLFKPSTANTVVPMQIASSGPDSDWASIMQAYFAAISKAHDYIYCSSPYLLPNEAIFTALRVASLSGVDVRIVVPERSDGKIVNWASRSYISSLLDAGVKVYLYQKGFNHSKFMLIDDQMCSIGSANLDFRSFEDDFEVQAIIYDTATTAELKRHFLDDVAASVEVERELWNSRSKISVLMESLARLLGPLL